MKGLDPLMLNSEKGSCFSCDLVLAGTGVQVEVKVEPSDHVVELVVAQSELPRKIGQEDTLCQSVATGPHDTEAGEASGNSSSVG